MQHASACLSLLLQLLRHLGLSLIIVLLPLHAVVVVLDASRPGKEMSIVVKIDLLTLLDFEVLQGRNLSNTPDIEVRIGILEGMGFTVSMAKLHDVNRHARLRASWSSANYPLLGLSD